MKQISCCCFFVVVCFELSSSFKQVNQAVFLNPQTNATFIRCPLEYFVPSLDIQWDEPFNRNEPFNRGRYYRIAHLQPFQREMICFSRFAADERIHLNIRIYGKRKSKTCFSADCLLIRSSITYSVFRIRKHHSNNSDGCLER